MTDTRPPCDSCAVARGFPDYRLFDPACLWCGARYWRLLPDVAPRAADLTRRRDAVVATWSKYGHDPRELVTLAGAPGLPLEPEQRRAPKRKGARK